jgi:hypothetical protein
MEFNDSFNPYAPTNAANAFQVPAGQSGATAPSYKLYSLGAIMLATFLASFLGGGIVLAINLMRLGRKSAAWGVILGSVICTTGILVAAFYIPDDVKIPNVVYLVPQLVLMYVVAKGMVGSDIQRHERSDGAMASMWGAAGISVAAAAFILAVIFGGVMLFDSMGTGVTFAGGSEVYYSGDATEADARKLGAALEEAGYFGENRSITVLLRKENGVFTVSFVVQDGTWNDPASVAVFEQIAKDLPQDYFGRPLKLELCDDACDSHKNLTIN